METSPPEQLKRVLSLPLVVLYGLGITIGAGIYVLIGKTAGSAGMLAPFAFVAAAVIVLFPALCFAELTGRFPVASGAAFFVQESFRSQWLGLGIGLLMIVAGLVGASTISLGAAAYLGSVVILPPWLLLVVLVATMGLVAAWGVKESVMFAGVMTLIEIGGLLAVIAGGFVSKPDLLTHAAELLPAEWTSVTLVTIMKAGLLAFFAFIGFEGIANVAEETAAPAKTLPRAILLTLVISTVIYLLVVGVALLTVGPEELSSQAAPLAHLFARTTGLPAATIALVAVVATLNGVIVQIIMVSRLTYGLSTRGLLPALLGRVGPKTGTPIVAIGLTTIAILLCSLTLPVVMLAEWTSRLILLVFAIVSVALLRLKVLAIAPPEGAFVVHPVVPALGVLGCTALLVVDLVWG